MVRLSGAARLSAILGGLALGAFLYSQASFTTIFRVLDGRYVTVAQPRLVQAMDDLLEIPSYGEHEDIIIFGGSGAYHALSADYLNRQLESRGADLRVRLISFESQSPFHTLALLNLLPPRRGKPAHIVFTWSFWRFDGNLTDDIIQYLSSTRTVDRSEAVLDLLERGAFDDAIASDGRYRSWADMKKSLDLPRNDRAAVWISYFILDKLQKLQSGRPEYLFEDPPAFTGANAFAQDRIDRLRDVMASAEIIASKDETFRRLARQAGTLFDADPDSPKAKAVRAYLDALFPHLVRIAREKGYRLWSYELPVYVERTAEVPQIPKFRRYLRSLMEGRPGLDANFTIASDQVFSELADPTMWWDYVHMSNVGARVFQNRLLRQLGDLAAAARRVAR